MNNLEEILQIINWYKNIPADLMPINELIHKRQKLVGLYASFATDLAYLERLSSRREYEFKNKKYTLRAEYSPMGVGKSETLSRAETADELRIFKEAQSDHRKAYYMYSATREILNAMHQQIAFWRDEKKNQEFHG